MPWRLTVRYVHDKGWQHNIHIEPSPRKWLLECAPYQVAFRSIIDVTVGENRIGNDIQGIKLPIKLQ